MYVQVSIFEFPYGPMSELRDCSFRIFSRVFFAKLSIYKCMRSFVKIESSRNGEITLSLTDIANSCPCCECLTSQICLLMLFAKIEFSRK